MRQKMYKDDKRFAYVIRYIIGDKKMCLTLEWYEEGISV